MRVTTKPFSDPRPIRDENYLETSKGNLRLFLEKRGCTLNLINSLESTSFKSIIAVFHFLLKQLDQMLKFGQKSDEDIPLILKSLNYPVTIPRDTFIPFSKRSISPSQIVLGNWVAELSDYLSKWQGRDKASFL